MSCVLSVVLLLIGLPILTLLLWIRKKHKYWKHRNVDTESLKQFYKVKGKKHVAFAFQDIYKKLKETNKSYVGLYTLVSPSLLITDLDLIKTVLISEFESFPDRGLYTNYDKDPLSKNLVRLHGDLWRNVRNKLTPTFTSGKMKLMFSNLENIGQRFVEIMGEEMNIQNQQVEIKDLCARFTTDVIGNVAFGLDCNSLREPDTEFRIKGDKAFTTIHPFLENFCCDYPHIFNKLGLKVFTNELIEFYSRIVRENVEHREKHQIKRNDFLDILIELKNAPQEDGSTFHLEMDELIAQAFVFFIGGFETSSSTMSFALYELAGNPKVQEKARNNVNECLKTHAGQFNYESLNEMFYIKQVVQETLRKHPIAPTGRRTCRKAFTIPGPQSLLIEPGVHVVIPVYAIHRDPAYYPEPEVFRPERFSLEQREHRHAMTYLPFGAGPRACIAERFGMMQTMLGLAMLLKNFKFSVCEKTQTEFHFDPSNSRVFSTKEGIYLKVEEVKKSVLAC